MSREKLFAAAAVALILAVLFCVRYAWPKSWAELTGTEDAPVALYGQLVVTGASGEQIWKLDNVEAGDPAFDTVLSALEGASFQHVPWGAPAPTGVAFLTIFWNAPQFTEINICDNGHAELSGWIVWNGSRTYHISGSLYKTLAAVFQEYGTLQE